MATDLTQPGVYNALDTAYAGGMSLTDTTGVPNRAALQAAVDAAVADGGGIVLIPDTDGSGPGFYLMACLDDSLVAITIPPGDMTKPLIICGTGGATTLLMETDGGTLFDITANPWVTFQDLTVKWDVKNGIFTGTAFSFNAGSGIVPSPNMGYRLFRVLIEDCQNPVAFNDNPSIATMRECELRWNDAQDDTTGISISGGPVVIDHCLLFLSEAGSTSTTGIAIQNATAGTTTGGVSVTNTHIDAFYTGIAIGASDGNVEGVVFENVSVGSLGQSLTIQGTDVSEVAFSCCHFQAGNTGGPVSGIIVGATGDENEQIDSIRFDGCTVTGFGGHGLEIQSGQNIQVIGGSYSGNASDGGAGIAITGAATGIQLDAVSCVGPVGNVTPQQYGIAITAGQNIQITGANCSGTGSSGYPGVGIAISSGEYTPSDVRIIGTNCVGKVLKESASEQQAGISIAGASDVQVQRCTLTGSVSGDGYGLYVSGAANVFIDDCDFGVNPYPLGVADNCENVYVDGCNFNGWTAGALYTSSSPGTLQITNSPGYNDQGTVLTGLPASGTTFYATYFDYYGPIAFYAINSSAGNITQIKIEGVITHLTSGSFTLAAAAPDGSSYAGATAEITYGAGSPYFLAVGK